MCETVFAVFEGVCPDCGAEIANARVECHPNRVQEWVDNVRVKSNDKMAAVYTDDRASNWLDVECQPDRMPDDWISSRMAIYQCECSGCRQQFYLEQNVYGDWV